MTTVKSNSAEGNQPDNGKSPLSSSSSSSSSSDSDDGSDSSSESDSSSASNSKTSSKQSNAGATQTAEKPQQFSVTSSDGRLRMKIAIPRSQSNSTPTPSPTSTGSTGIAGANQQQQSSPRDGKQKSVEHGGKDTSAASLPKRAPGPPSERPSSSGLAGSHGKSNESSRGSHDKRDKSAMMNEARNATGRQQATSAAATDGSCLPDKPSGRTKLEGNKKGSDGRSVQSAKGNKRPSGGSGAGEQGKRKKSLSESDSSSPSSSYSSCSSNSDSDTSSTGMEDDNVQQGGKRATGRNSTGSGASTRTSTGAEKSCVSGKKQKLLKRKKANRSASTSSSDDEHEELSGTTAGGNRGGPVPANQSTDCDSSSSDEPDKRFSHPRTKTKQAGQQKMGNMFTTHGREEGDGLATVGPPLSCSTPAKQPYGSVVPTLLGTVEPASTVDGGLTAEGGSCSSDNELPALVSAAIRRVESGSDAESIRGANAGPTQQYTSSLLREFVVKTQMLGSVGPGGPAGISALVAGGTTGGSSKAPAAQRSPSSSSSSSSSSGGSSSSSSSSSVDEGGPDPIIGSAGPGPGGGSGIELDVRKIKTESPVPTTIGGRSTPQVNGVTGRVTTAVQQPPVAPRRRGRPPKSSLANVAAMPAGSKGTSKPAVSTPSIPTVSESPDSGILSTHSSTGSPKTDKQKGASGTITMTLSRRNKSESLRDLTASTSIIANTLMSAASSCAAGRSATTSYAINSCLDRNTYATERVLYPPRAVKKRGVGRPSKKETMQAIEARNTNGPPAVDGHLDPHWQKIDISKKFHEPRLSGYKSDGGHSTICCSKRLASQSGYISDYGGVGASGGRSRLSGYKSDYSARSRRSCGRSGGGYRSDYGRARSCGYRSDCSTRHRKQVRRKRRKKVPAGQQDHQPHHNNNVDDRKNYNTSDTRSSGKSASVGELEIMFMAGLTLGSTSDEDDSTSTSSSTSSSSAGSRESLLSAASGVPPSSTTSASVQGKGARKRLPSPPPPAPVAPPSSRHKEVKATSQRLQKSPRKPATSQQRSAPIAPVKTPGGRARAKSVSAVEHRKTLKGAEDEDDLEDRWMGRGRMRNKPQPAATTPKPSIAATASVALKQKSSAMVKKPGQRGRPRSTSVKKPPPEPPTLPKAPSSGLLDVLLAPPSGSRSMPRRPVNNFNGVFASMCGASQTHPESIFAFSSSTVTAKNPFADYLRRDSESRSKETDGSGGNAVVPPVKKGLPLSKANVIKNSEECNRRFQKSSSSFALSVGGAGGGDLLARIADGTIPKASPT